LEAAETIVSLLGLVILAGCALDVMMRPIPMLAGTGVRTRRHLFWAGLAVGYVVLLALI
jgi:hypothetical protein